jgi:hypothetical protein
MKNLYPLVSCFVLTIGCSFPALAQPVHVQTKSKIVAGASSSINLSFTSSSTAGNLIVVHLTWDKQSRTVNTVSDTKGNTYHLIGAETNWSGTTYRSALYYAYNISAGATPLSITATLTGSVTSLYEIYISEYSNVLTTSDPLDQKKTTAGSGTTVNSGAVTTTASDELIYGVAIGASVTLNGGTGFNIRSTDQSNIVEDKTGATGGSYSTSFSGGGNWIASIATFKTMWILPVSLLSFDAQLIKNNKIEVDWATASENNSDYFELEHSQDGLVWADLGRVDAAGSSATTLNYSFVDENPYMGVCFYRLKQVDRDGNATVSKTLTVHTDQQPILTLRIFPNPATSYLFVESTVQTIAVFNTAGQRMPVRVSQQGDSRVMLDLSILPTGAYFVKAGDRSVLFLRQ